MVEFTSPEPGPSDSSSPISEQLQDITNWFSGYVYESFPSCSLANEIEIEFPVKNNKEKFVSNKDHQHIVSMSSDRNLYESLPSEPPDISNWFSSYVYESLMLDTTDGLEFSVLGETEIDKETMNNVCPALSEREELVSPAKVTNNSQSQSLLSEPPDVGNWFSNYEYQSPHLSDAHELGFSAFEKDQFIVEESDTEEEKSSGIFRKTRASKRLLLLAG